MLLDYTHHIKRHSVSKIANKSLYATISYGNYSTLFCGDLLKIIYLFNQRSTQISSVKSIQKGSSLIFDREEIVIRNVKLKIYISNWYYVAFY